MNDVNEGRQLIQGPGCILKEPTKLSKMVKYFKPAIKRLTINHKIAGITLSEVKGSDTAVFVGAFGTDYGTIMDRDPGIIPAYKGTGLGPSLFSNRISHWMDLQGPSVTIDTACSASMVALHMACECLRKGDTKMAIVSGANIILEPSIMLALSTMK